MVQSPQRSPQRKGDNNRTVNGCKLFKTFKTLLIVAGPSAIAIIFLLIKLRDCNCAQFTSAETPMQLAKETAQTEFCNDIMGGLSGVLPNAVKLAWSPSGDGNVILKSFNETDAVDSNDNTNDSALLVKVGGILTVDKAGSYPMYIFGNRDNQEDIVSRGLELNKEWELGEASAHVKYLERLAQELNVPRSDIFFIDIGANLGAFTMSVATAGFSVIAIEAMKVNQHALKLTLCANPDVARRVTLLPVALGRAPAKCALLSEEQNTLDGTVRCGKDAESAASNLVRRQEVDIRRLDDVLADWMPGLAGKVGALKIDVEGLEPWVFEGGRRFITEVRPRFMQVEVSIQTREIGIETADFLHNLMNLGYSLHEQPFDLREVTADYVASNSIEQASNAYLVANSGEDTL